MKCSVPHLLAVILVCVFFSCTSTKKLIYLQDSAREEAGGNAQLLKAVRLQNQPYRLKPQDRIQVSVFSLTDDKLNFFKRPDLELVVSSNGDISIPVIGPVKVRDLTLKETEEKLVSEVAAYLKSPNITVKLLNFNITVLGEVNRQGSFTVAESSITILGAIGAAGGVTENANMKNVRVVRNENDTARIFQVNMLADNLLLSDNYFLQPNDVVLVNPMRSRASNQQKAATVSLVVSMLTSLVLIGTKVL